YQIRLVCGLLEEILEDEADLVRTGGFEMGVDDVQVIELLPLPFSEVLGILEPYVAAADQCRTGFLLKTADLFHSVVDQTDDMELVEGDGGIGQARGNPVEKC